MFEEDPACFYSRERNNQIKEEFDEVFCANCERNGQDLTNSQNTAMFLSGSVTRLIWPPKTHHAAHLKRISGDMYVVTK